MTGVRVSLSSGDIFYVAASPGAVIAVLGGRRTLTRLGGRYVNPQQIAQLTVVDVPSYEIPETLKEVAA